MKKVLLIVLILISVSGFSQHSNHQNGFSAGLGLAVFSKPYAGKSVEVFPIPLIQYRKGSFYFQGIEAGYDLSDSASGTVSVFLTPEFGGFDVDDSDVFTGMEERDMTLMGGIRHQYSMRHWSLSTEVRGDVLGTFKGFSAQVSMARRIFRGKNMITPEFGVEYQDSKTTAYYYGVEATESLPFRAEYNPGSTTNMFASLSWLVRFDRKKTLFTMFRYTAYGSEVEDSPLTDSDSGWMALTGVSWRF